MKKTAAKIAAITAVITTATFGLTACSSGSAAENSDSKPKIAFIAGITSDPFFRAMQLGAEAEAEKLGVELIWQGSATEYSAESQLPFVNSALADDVDALILVPTDPDSLQPTVTKAESQGIPVITVDTTVTDQAYLTSHITGDNVQGGAEAAKTLAKQIGGSGQVFIMSGSPTGTTNTLREKGFRDELAANYPDVEIVGIEYALSQPAKATSAVNTAILNHPDLKGIFAIDGTAGTGSVAALQNSGKVGQIALIGYDAYSNQVADLENGIFSALIAQDPAQEAKLALEYAHAVVTGNDTDKIEKAVVIPNIVLTKDNLSETKKYQYAE